jgi:hypothetical protein
MARALEAIVKAHWLDKRRAKAIARKSRQQDGFTVAADGPLIGGPWRLSISKVHDLLTDEADWNAMTWGMDPAGLERLALTVEWLEEELPGEFTFEALAGEDPIEKRVSRPELLRIVRAGQIGTRTRYRVPAAGERPT